MPQDTRPISVLRPSSDRVNGPPESPWQESRPPYSKTMFTLKTILHKKPMFLPPCNQHKETRHESSRDVQLPGTNVDNDRSKLPQHQLPKTNSFLNTIKTTQKKHQTIHLLEVQMGRCFVRAECDPNQRRLPFSQLV